ncbi:uncharacterized protein M421DRAFT_10039 [Didymella exigua CBS 183.55]|uniref:Uncharacterized protein n=1 Tax=Didymella exigua CBS 183.55 TaxID=1150837 RepID=A0A6A5R619_9PLEO|nr:uncharacterized protein M421DRAFT_10039 [Didymella exigua CBS 183.55]KAF1923023.1 hypothetical protein M421DRAFT_10039 [Didymella exigua CBS 183.55]
MSVADHERQEEELKKAEKKDSAAANKLFNEKLKEEKRAAAAKAKESRDVRIKKLATLQKLSKYLKEAIAQPQKLLQSNRSLHVVLWVLVVIPSLRRLRYHAQLSLPGLAAPPQDTSNFV